MATIKSYTDLSQSKTLSKILPLESADMWFANGIVVAKDSVNEPDDIQSVFPCWSLAALLGVLPEGIDNNTDDFSQLEIYKNHVCYAYADGNVRIGIRKDNLIDACYEMILKLHELKKL